MLVTYANLIKSHHCERARKTYQNQYLVDSSSSSSTSLIEDRFLSNSTSAVMVIPSYRFSGLIDFLPLSVVIFLYNCHISEQTSIIEECSVIIFNSCDYAALILGQYTKTEVSSFNTDYIQTNLNKTS